MEFKWQHFQKEIILWGIRWYVAYPMSYHQLEEMMSERGLSRSLHPQPVGHYVCPGDREAVPAQTTLGRAQLAAR